MFGKNLTTLELAKLLRLLELPKYLKDLDKLSYFQRGEILTKAQFLTMFWLGVLTKQNDWGCFLESFDDELHQFDSSDGLLPRSLRLVVTDLRPAVLAALAFPFLSLQNQNWTQTPIPQ